MASLLVALVLAALSIKKGKASPTTNARPCVQLEVPVAIDTTTIKWLQPRVDNNIDAVDWVDNITSRTSPNLTERMVGTIIVKKTFKIAGQLCIPLKGARSDILQIVTHGAGFDRRWGTNWRSHNGITGLTADRYWDSEVKPNDYSYVHAALAEGYSIFTYDRLGTGSSEKPDAYEVVQTSVHVAILRQLTALARAGKLASGTSKYKPSKIVHVGHSLGSVVTLGLITKYGTESDAVIATGFLHTNVQLAGANVATWGFEFAHQNDPILFRDRGSGYIVQTTRSNVQLSFLKKGSFEPALLDYAWKIRQPIAVSEFLSLLTAFGDAPQNFKGPIQVCAFCFGQDVRLLICCRSLSLARTTTPSAPASAIMPMIPRRPRRSTPARARLGSMCSRRPGMA
jgi:pimeloyl-ACP methyl ester carboxylesterase